MNETVRDDPFMQAIRECMQHAYEKEMKRSEKMVRVDEMCRCDVRKRMDLGMIPPIPLLLDGFIKVCPWCDRTNPSWAKKQRAEEKKGTMTKKEMMMKLEEAINPMARSGKNFAVSVVGLEKKAEDPKPQPKRKVWVVVRILRGLEGTSDICVFDTREKAEDFRRALSMADTYDCVTRMYEREVIE